MEECVDRADRAVEATAEIEVGHIGDHDLAAGAETPPRELDHPRRDVDPPDVDPAVGERDEHAPAAAARLEHRRRTTEPLDEPIHLRGDIPVERDVVELGVVAVQASHSTGSVSTTQIEATTIRHETPTARSCHPRRAMRPSAKLVTLR